MALVLANRVQETGTANTTVSFTLTGAAAGFQTFAAIGNTNTTYYAATDASGNWEVGLGTYSTTGPTLTRTTVYASSNSGSAVTFSGTVNIFVTYPSGRSVNLDASGNVSALGTIASGAWQGTTVGVAYGGTGVTASSGANSVMLRDANQNVAINRLNQANTSTVSAAGTTALTAASSYSQTLTGTTTQTYTMPDATTLTTGVAFVFNNNSTGVLTLKDYATATIGTITAGGAVELVLLSNGTTAGTWDVHGYIPENVTWGTNALALGSTVISGGTWQGGTIQSGYGGTGLTTFTGANNALYSTSASALAAGTLPVAAGGTGVTSSTGTGSVVLSTSPTLVTPVLGTPSSGTLTSCTGLPLTTGVTGTLPVGNGGTGVTTTPTNGQLLIGNGTNYTVATLGSGTGISTTTGAGTLTVNNTGVTSNVAGTGISVSGATGAVTITNSGVTSITGTASQVTASASTGGVTLSLPSTINVNTSGSAASLSATLAVASGGTGQTAYTDGQLLIGNTLTTGLTKSTLTAGTAISVTNGNGSISIANTGVTALTTSSGLSTNTSATGAVSVTNTGVTSNVAGTGISVSGATGAVTITNSGVTSAVAGTGVSVSGATGAVTFSIGQAVATSSNVQFNSLGVGTAGSAVAGEIRATNNVTAYYASDIRFKENIQPITGAGEIIRAIGGNYFDWTDEYIAEHGGEDGYFVQKEDFGVIAQKVQKVFPKAVRTRPDGSLAVDYEKLGILAFPAIADMLDRLDAIEAKLKE